MRDSHTTVSTDYTAFEETRAEAELTDVLLTSLTPDRWAKPDHSDKENSTRTVLLPMCCGHACVREVLWFGLDKKKSTGTLAILLLNLSCCEQLRTGSLTRIRRGERRCSQCFCLGVVDRYADSVREWNSTGTVFLPWCCGHAWGVPARIRQGNG